MGTRSANHRNEIETGIVTLLTPVKTAGHLKSVLAIGAQDYLTVLKSVLAQAPFALVKYVRNSGEPQAGGIMHWTADISILIGAQSLASISKQRGGIHDILDRIQVALSNERIGTDETYWPLVMVAEEWSEFSEGGKLEVWEQRWRIQWETVPANLLQ